VVEVVVGVGVEVICHNVLKAPMESPRARFGSWAECDYGETEQRLGLPFQGAAGHVLDRALTAAGLRREDVFITNVVNQRPAGNKWEMHTDETVRTGLDNLHRLLSDNRPRVIVPLGNEAFRAVMKVAPDNEDALPSITEARGYIWEGWWGSVANGDHEQRCHIIPAIHPAAALREWVPSRLLLDLDLKKAAAELRTGCPALPEREVRFVTDEFEAVIIEAALLKAKKLSVDIETFDVRKLACVGFASSPNVAWVVPAYAEWQLLLIKRLCESPVEKCLQHGAFDRYFLQSRYGIELRCQVFDTMLGWHCVQPELAGQAQEKRRTKRTTKSLEFLASIFCRARHWKSYDFKRESERWHLCGLDCCYTFEIAEKLERELEGV